ncbi:hydrogen peroxide-inducible genes activator [Pseudopedobacter beijingensis]|uniref:LysR substrate-binding domain-containing protein n=1 Tax=Pseudopedobacter beijingensis TaxID=1207056 RepID=A0ABW4IBP5_9SPHI
MTIVQLEYIVAVDTYKSFVMAAEKCFVTQPTLSMQVQKLEEVLGVKIFDRTKQPVVATEIGKEIIAQARKTLQESYKINEIINERKDEVSGDLKIGVIPTIAPFLLPKVIGAFMKEYPKVRLSISELTTENIVQKLKNGLLDCGILATPLSENTIIERPVYYENFVCYASEETAAFTKKTLEFQDLNIDELWLLNEGHCLRNQVLNLCKYKKADGQHLDYNTGSIETLIRMVDVNKGMTILPELSIQDFSVEQLDKVRYFRTPQPSREVSIVTHTNFIKRKTIDALEKEILNSIPKSMRSKSKKSVIAI